MDLQQTFERLGGEPTATFGCVNPPEIVGPLKPRSVQYGITYGNDDQGDVFLGRPFPTVWLNFNKYRPDLPPWRSVVEFVLASQDDGGNVFEAMFIDTSAAGTDITGDLKTVNVLADSIAHGVDAAAVIDRDEVAEKRDMGTGVADGSTFKVTEELT